MTHSNIAGPPRRPSLAELAELRRQGVSEDVLDAIDGGKVTPGQARKIAHLPRDVQDLAVYRFGYGVAKSLAEAADEILVASKAGEPSVPLFDVLGNEIPE